MAYVGTYRALLAGGVSRPALVLDFIGLNVLDPRITFTRGSNATLVDSTGKITYAPANLLTYSQQFDNAAWTKNGATITPDQAGAPDGTTTADLITGTASTYRAYQLVTLVSGVTYIASIYVQPGTTTLLGFDFINVQNGPTFNFSTKTWSAQTGQILGAGYEQLANGWYRLWVRVLANTTSAGPGWYVSGLTTAYIWGAQLEPVTYQTTPSTYQATTSSAYYGPRFDYDPVTLAAKGLLIEEQRANYALYSNDLTNAAWTATTMSTAKTATGPDGVANSATTITASAGNATILQAITDASNARITSCYIKRRTGTGTVEMTQDNGATWAAVTVTSSWTRVSIASATLANPTIGLRLVTNADAVDVWGFQNERGAFVTSVIPTVASTVTRSADVATMTGANFSAWYNQAQGTFVVSFTPDEGLVSNNNRIIVASQGGAPARVVDIYTSGGNWVSYNGTTTTTIGAASVTSTPQKIAAAYAAADYAYTLNGGTIAAAASVTVNSPNQLQIGNFGGTIQTNGHIRSVAYYNTRLPNAQLQSLTT